MKKMRIYEYAKEHNVQSKQLIDQLKGMGVEVSNHMSVVDEETLRKASAGSNATGSSSTIRKRNLQKRLSQPTQQNTQSRPKAQSSQGGANAKPVISKVVGSVLNNKTGIMDRIATKVQTVTTIVIAIVITINVTVVSSL